MACPPFEFLWIVKESAYGTQKGTPTAGVDSIYIRLTAANRFTMRPTPTFRKIPFGGGFTVAGYRKADQWTVTGSLELELCYSQAQLLLDWAATRINAGQTTPWTTTEQACDLASCTVYHGVMRDDGTIKRRRYKGVKVHSWRLSSAADSGIVMLRLELQAQKFDGNSVDSSSDPDATAFPAPADTAFPTDVMLHSHADANLKIATTAITYVNSLELDVTNQMSVNYSTSAFLKFDRLRGRASKATANVIYTATPNWRSDYEALTTRAATWTWTNTTNTVLLDYNGNNIVDSLTDDLTPGEVYKQTVAWENQFDTSAGADIEFTFT